MAGTGQVQGGSVWKKHAERKNLNIQIVPDMGKNKAKFLNFKPKVCPIARRSFAVLLSQILGAYWKSFQGRHMTAPLIATCCCVMREGFT